MQPTSNQNHVNEDDIYIEEFELLKQAYAQADKSSKAQLLRKLRGLVNLRSTYVEEPEIKLIMRGRPPEKIDKSTRHELSAFERVPSMQDNYSSSVTRPMDANPLQLVRPTRQRRAKEKVINRFIIV